MALVSDATHYIGFEHHSDPQSRPYVRLARYVTRILSAGSAWLPFLPLDTAIRCRRRPGRKPCPGWIRLEVLDEPDRSRIVWECSRCGDDGLISNWRDSPWDLSAVGRDDAFYEADDDLAEVILTKDEYEALVEVTEGKRYLQAVVVVAQYHREGARVEMSQGELQSLMTGVVEAAGSERKAARKTSLQRIVGKLHVAWDGPVAG